MLDKLNELRNETAAALAAATELSEVEALRVRMLGRKGEISLLLKTVGNLPPEERRETGQKANEVRDEVAGQIEETKTRLALAARNTAIIKETIDITLPGRKRKTGRLHPMSDTFAHMENLFINLGFSIAEGPHIETAYYNFDALNTPATHPSRDVQDTFYFNENFLLRCHTSPVQVRTMENQKPPIRIVAPGQVFRRDEIDATHTPVFHQMEGLVIDRGINFGDLKGMLEIIVRHCFGSEAKIRLRPSFFPFTEPSAEVDITCYVCKSGQINEQCRVCKGSGWVELWGCGMVHPNVLKMSGIDPDEYTGYAFGIGVDRITSAFYGLSDPRHYFENDMQFLGQFKRR